MRTTGRGAVVNYHGSITREHGVYISLGEDPAWGGHLRLVHREYPTSTLRRVHPCHVTPTGETAVLCPTCSHEWHLRVEGSPTRRCGVVGCPCSQHGELEFPSLRDEVTA